MCSLSIGQVVQQLQKQLENQKDVLKQYEPRLKKKEKEAKELTKVQCSTKIRASDLIFCVLGQDAFLA
jgi:membrane protein involved in colicin uptake